MSISLLIVEDNPQLAAALERGLNAAGEVRVVHTCTTGEAALEYCLAERPQVALMDVRLAGEMNGIQAAAAIRRELPRFPVVFYSIQDDDAYFRDFRRSGILSHYAYLRKSNYLLPELILPFLPDVISGRSFIDPDIESRVQEVRYLDRQSPFDLLEPNEQQVARMLADGLTNEQIARRLGFRDKRTVSRTNGQIYAAWGLNATATEEKVARTRAAIIVHSGRLIVWDGEGVARVLDRGDNWVVWEPE